MCLSVKIIENISKNTPLQNLAFYDLQFYTDKIKGRFMGPKRKQLTHVPR